MFSAQQLQKFAGKKRITQETFDDAVRENIEEFEMEAEEAVTSAVAEFEAQGVDLSNIITSATGGDLSEHPVGQAITKLQSAAESGDLEAAQVALHELHAATTSTDAASPQEIQQMGAMLGSLGAAGLIVRIFTFANGLQEEREAVIAAATTLSSILPLSSDIRSSFRDAGGPTSLAAAVSDDSPSSSDPDIVSAVLQAAAASTVKDEAGKGAAMEAGLGSALLSMLRKLGSTSPDVVLGACALITSLTTADDESLPSSRAFPNARLLAKEGSAEVLVSSLRSHTADTAWATTAREAVIALCNALRQAAANDDICQEAAGAGAVPLGLQVVDRALQTNDTLLARAAIGLLRQLASSDVVKAELFEAGGLDTIKSALVLATEGPFASIAEQALGLLANMSLRNPEVASAATSGGCVAEALHAMGALLDTSAQNGRTGPALRQGCMALRNIAGRCPDERHVLLAAGAEKVVRSARDAYPAACQDVGSAALRDFGLDNYNN